MLRWRVSKELLRAGLTELSEDERMFQDSVREFAADRIIPLVRGMDEAQQMDAGLVREMFALGLMGIAVPEEYGGAGGSFFDAVLAVEAISAVDPAVGVLVDVQNTLVTNALVRWATAGWQWIRWAHMR
jgi:alkylation response protein AidB-like acyl-CoA dehydrogenase